MKKYLVALSTMFLVFLMAGRSDAIKVGPFEVSPLLAVTERYSDNVFATKDNAQGDFSTVISPEIRLTFPRVKRKYQLELGYRADIEKFNRFTSEDAVSHTVDGKFGIIFPMGLELHVDDKFRRSHDLRGETLDTELDFYRDNLFHSSAAYAFGDRYKVQLDYSNYALTYDADRNNFRNFMANSFAGYAYYRVMPKTSVFVEYEYVIVEFDESPALNSKEHHFLGGVTWDITGKTQGTVKVGYGLKDFNDSSIGGFSGLILEASIRHNLTSRDSVSIRISRATHETDLLGDDFIVSTSASAEYTRRLTGKISGKAGIEYFRDVYSGLIPKTDNMWRASAGLSYQFKKWLLTEAGYSYTIRNSTIDAFDYSNNAVFFRIVGTL